MTPGDDAPATAPASRDERAALYVLGLMEEPEAAAFAREAEGDPRLAGLVQDWRERLSDFDTTAPEIAAGEDLWRRIDARIGAATPYRPPARESAWSRFWNSLPVWRGVGLAGAAAALVLAIGLTRVLTLPPPDPVMIAVLVAEDGSTPGAVVEVKADGSIVLLPLADIPVPAGRVLQVWTKWSEERGPVSVGLIEQARSIRLDTRELPPTFEDQLFEITLEPEGGSPTGLPTGPILMLGRAAQAL